MCYVDNVLFVSHDPGKTIAAIQKVSKLMGNKAGELESYLGADIGKNANNRPARVLDNLV